jgi:hypothetical protein
VIGLETEAELLEVVAATRPAGRLAGRLHGRQEQSHERADDGDHHQQFHEGEGPTDGLRSWHGASSA